MSFFAELDTRLAALRELLGEVVTVDGLPAVVGQWDDRAVFEFMELASETAKLTEQLTLVASGVISTRSTRDAGHSGLAQSRGHRTPAALIQRVAGLSRAEAMRQVRVGAALVEPVEPAAVPVADTLEDVVDGTEPAAPPIVWHAPLREALRGGTLSSAQHDAIRQGLGEPPSIRSTSSDPTASPVADAMTPDPAAAQAWMQAAERLIDDATEVTVEELGKQARAIRDLLDPTGAEARHRQRFEARSFTMWTDRAGTTHGRFVFDDEAGEQFRSILGSPLRPRRGGPRFVHPDEQQAAKRLTDDPRTNEQLAHDALVDLTQAGILADPEAVHGVRQAGVRIVQVVDRDQYLAEQRAKRHTTGKDDAGAFAGHFEDDPSQILPESFVAKQVCNTGVVNIIVDQSGNPLDVGREQRLYTAKQRIALAIRDGGCRWAGCDRPPSYCEAHHIDHWDADQGRTDIDRGVLLCRFHHLQLHNNGWKISRTGQGPFLLHPPPEIAVGTASSETPGAESPGRHASGKNAGSPGSETSRLVRTQGVTRPAMASQGPEGEGTGLSTDSPPKSRCEGTALPTVTQKTSVENNRDGTGATKAFELRPPLPLTYGWERAIPPRKRFTTAA